MKKKSSDATLTPTPAVYSRMAYVVNIRGKGEDAYDVYIGRDPDNPYEHFGNPFSSKPSRYASIRFRSRSAAILAFSRWLRGEAYSDIEPERRAWILENLPHLRGLRLGCFCAPRRCHGDVYVELLEDIFKS